LLEEEMMDSFIPGDVKELLNAIRDGRHSRTTVDMLEERIDGAYMCVAYFSAATKDDSFIPEEEARKLFGLAEEE
jgi:hypothetical protein